MHFSHIFASALGLFLLKKAHNYYTAKPAVPSPYLCDHNVLIGSVVQQTNLTHFRNRNITTLGSVSIATEAGNPFIEDRAMSFEIISKSGKFLARVSGVFDGHGGPEVSESIVKNFQSALCQELTIQMESKCGKYVPGAETSCFESKLHFINGLIAALSKTFVELDSVVKEQVGLLGSYQSGSCALIVAESHGLVITANAGDSRAVLCDNDCQFLNDEHNARVPAEVAKLQNKFPDDPEVVMSTPTGVNYVKGALQPTRSIGDFHLKGLYGGRAYISSIPSLTVKKFPKGGLILIASDGLWDEISISQISEFYASSKAKKIDTAQIVGDLIEQVYAIAAQKQGITAPQLWAMTDPMKRQFVDDVSVVAIADSKSY